jgi:AraC-like DNA-binding protein
MPSDLVRTFTDADECAAAIRAGDTLINVKGSGNYFAKLTAIRLTDLWMQRILDNLPRTFHTNYVADRIFLTFEMQPAPAQIINGTELVSTAIMRTAGGHALYGHSCGAGGLASLSLPRTQAISLGEALSGKDLTPSGDILFATPAPNRLAKLRRLHEAAGTLAEDAPEILSHPEASRGLEQALIEAMLGCLVGELELHGDRAAFRHHALIMRRFHRVIEEHLDEPVYIPELCREVGTSVRTLSACCQEHLGIGPKHYLVLRRLQLARRTLRQSAPADMTVTEVAMRYGFWQLGRFAGEYKKLFGESPSDTLGRVD